MKCVLFEKYLFSVQIRIFINRVSVFISALLQLLTVSFLENSVLFISICAPSHCILIELSPLDLRVAGTPRNSYTLRQFLDFSPEVLFKKFSDTFCLGFFLNTYSFFSLKYVPVSYPHHCVTLQKF